MSRPSEVTESLPVRDTHADASFRAALARAGVDRGKEWAERYVDYEWNRGRYVITALLGADLTGRRALEVGCYVGGTATVMARLGAQVTAVDAQSRWLPLADLNARRYGVAARACFVHAPDLGALPFVAGAFDIVVCNSVLDYLDDGLRSRLYEEIDRVLAAGGAFVVLGTSNRLWPRENHSGRWLANYLPRDLAFPRNAGHWTARALWPWQVTSAFRGYADLIGAERGAALVRARQRMGLAGWRLELLRGALRVASELGLPPGALDRR